MFKFVRYVKPGPLLAATLAAAALSAAAMAEPAPTVHTVIGDKVQVDDAHTQPCGNDSCAHRVLLQVSCPAGTEMIAVHYFTTAGYPNDLAQPWETGLTEVSWAHFSPAVIKPNDRQMPIGTSYYYNRSNRHRIALLTADCK